MDPNPFLPVNPRLRGIREQLERAEFLYAAAINEANPISRYRLLLSAIYPCRAISELMLEEAEAVDMPGLGNPDPKIRRDMLEGIIAGKLPYYLLVERIRIHDFHRFGIVPPNPAREESMFLGRAKLVARDGVASLSLPASGLKTEATGASSVRLQRPLVIRNGEFFDDLSAAYVTLEHVVGAFLAGAASAIFEFEKLVTLRPLPADSPR